MAQVRASVAEFQGLYGPFTVNERVLQKIWLRGDFDLGRARLDDGRTLEVCAPGEWNLLGGPDFRAARLRLDGVETCGDVEVHFHSSDWAAHGHRENPAFGGVVLHVVLFPADAGGRPARRLDGGAIPELALLPLLHRDLEEYAADDALETITARDEWRRFAELATRPAAGLRQLFAELARERWTQKLRHARLRIEKLGLRDAAHHTALEILGYRHNRAPMLAVAARLPLGTWARGLDPAEAYRTVPALWQLHGVRPANHPLSRLRQYAAWAAARPDWPDRLGPFAAYLAASRVNAGRRGGGGRPAVDLGRVRLRLAQDLVGGAVGGSRLDTLACDGLLPLAAVESGEDLFDIWFHWHIGDLPAAVRTALPRLGVTGGRDHPQCHGFGQGLLGWLLSQGAGASR